MKARFLAPVVLAAVPILALAQTLRPVDRELADALDAMMHNVEMQTSGDADRDFVAMMIPEHQGVIDLARIELKYGKDPLIRKLAQDLVAAQEKNIAEMTGWKAKHGKQP